MSIPFRERNPVPIGAVGLLVVAPAARPRVQHATSLPLIGGGDRYRAAFTEAGGLRERRRRPHRRRQGRQGRRASSSTATTCASTFRVTDAGRLRRRDRRAHPDQDAARARSTSSLEPRGGGQLKEGSADPARAHRLVLRRRQRVHRPRRPRPSGSTPTSWPSRSTTLATEFKDTPPDVRAALDGLSRLSQHHRLARRPSCASCSPRPTASPAPLAERNKAVESSSSRTPTCCSSSSTSAARRSTPLFTNTSALAQQVTGLVARQPRRAGAGPRRSCTKVLAVLREARGGPRATPSRRWRPFTRLFANMLGNGRWFDTYIQNLTAADVGRELMHSAAHAAPAQPAASRARPGRPRSSPRSPCVALVAGAYACLAAQEPVARHGASSPAPSACSPGPTCGSSASRSARYRGRARAATGRGRLRVRRRSTRSPPTRRRPSSPRRWSATGTCSCSRPTPTARGWPTAREIPLERTAVPVELDRISQSLDDLIVALGPTGANKDGALSRLLDTARPTSTARAQDLHDTNRDLVLRARARCPAAATTCSHGEEPADLHDHAGRRTTQQVRRLNANLANVSDQLDGERDDLGRGPEEPRRRPRARCAPSSTTTAPCSRRTSTSCRRSPAPSPSSATPWPRPSTTRPVALSATCSNAYNPRSGTLDTRANVDENPRPRDVLCNLSSPVAAASSRSRAAQAARGPAATSSRTGVELPLDRSRRCRSPRRRPVPADAADARRRPHPRRPARRCPMTAADVRCRWPRPGRSPPPRSRSGCRLPGRVRPPAARWAAGGGDIYRVTAEFADVLDLVPQSAVKVDEVTVGAVEKIELDGWTARVDRCACRGASKLPDNAVAELQADLAARREVRRRSRRPPTARRRGAARRRRPHPARRAPAATPRSRRCSARCRCCSTAVAWPS